MKKISSIVLFLFIASSLFAQNDEVKDNILVRKNFTLGGRSVASINNDTTLSTPLQNALITPYAVRNFVLNHLGNDALSVHKAGIDTITGRKVFYDSLEVGAKGIQMRTTYNGVSGRVSLFNAVGAGNISWLQIYGDALSSRLLMGANNAGFASDLLNLVATYEDSVYSKYYSGLVIASAERLKISGDYGLSHTDSAIQITTGSNQADLAAVFHYNGHFTTYKGAEYGSDLSGSYTSRSFADVGYVNSRTFGVANSLGTQQFTVAPAQNWIIEGDSTIDVSFPGSKKIHLHSLVTGGGGGGTGANNYVTGTGFSGGVLTLSRSGLSDVTQDMDGRYVKYTDSASMLFNYLQKAVAAATYATIGQNALKVNVSDTAAALVPYLKANVAAATYRTPTQTAAQITDSLNANSFSLNNPTTGFKLIRPRTSSLAQIKSLTATWPVVLDSSAVDSIINIKLDPLYIPPSVSQQIYKNLGSTIVAEGFINQGNISNNVTFNAGVRVTVINVNQPTTLTGAVCLITTAGVYTASAYNGFGLYSYNASTGVATLVASTTDDGNIWKTAGWLRRAYSAPYAAAPGTYFLLSSYNNNGTETTKPVLAGGAQFANGTLNTAVGIADYPNGAKIAGSLAAVPSLPTTFNISTVISTTGNFYFANYFQ